MSQKKHAIHASVTIPEPLHTKAKKYAEKYHVTLSWIVREALDLFLNHETVVDRFPKLPKRGE